MSNLHPRPGATELMRRLCAVALLAVASVRCAAAPAGERAAPAVQAPRAVPAPLVDHHQHLLSPAGAAAWSEEGFPPIAVPEEVSALLARRDRAFGDSAGLAPLYTPDGVLLVSDGIAPGLARGAEVPGRLSRIFARPYRVTPVDYRADGSTARLAAYLTRGEGDAARHFGHLVLSLRRGDDGEWRIAAETLTFPGPETYPPLTADELIPLLDAAGIRRAVVLSAAYLWASPDRPRLPPGQDEYALVRADNDWVSRQVARHPDRLRGFCGLGPLRDYALDEVERCHRDPHMNGLKLHFGNSGVDLRDPEHVERVRRVFAAANQRRMPIVVHVRTRDHIPYGRELTEIFLERVVPAAPDIPIQIAHMAGSGPGWEDPEADEALAAFADAAAAGDPRMRNLWFDMATVVNLNITPATAERLAGRIRRLGVERVVYGSDIAVGGNLAPRQGWAVIRGLLPLTDAELATIAGNVAPYMR